MGYGDATDGAIAVGAELELTGGPQRFQLPENLLQDPMAEGNTTAHVFLAGDEDSHSPWTDSQEPRQCFQAGQPFARNRDLIVPRLGGHGQTICCR